ncbi:MULTISPECIES: lipid II flippase Amj family protein [Clostridium]|uniref:lipid II flippase Amj family protein n=1 Tax=Clostridium TaxID=1485 RepID=UPI0013E94E30|nr:MULTISPECIES: lipid II flippase Amj family protein [Clostridium]MBU3128710.1 lipid II flippase Amj family protein [Clostridium tagluense]MBW9157788.1 lipid II flippase Amj family protein [Clostridium tagluense]MBZ9623865.1 lipid II flippase Amj family protein [Clostridium sp. FP2]MBZ9635252.1 lipid II flippase Amj family protein [Clostridium sp. FP1]MCB2299228.1 lipid II flippase Amj family protein [Clostridium tagluense]
MSTQVIIVLILTVIISIIATLAYSVRIVGVKTGRIAVSSAVFSIFALISRTANSIQAPLLSKKIENTILIGNAENLLYIFRWILFSTTVATIIGALLMPTFIKVLRKAVESFSINRSIPKLLLHGFSKSGIEQFKTSVTKPSKENLSHLKNFKMMPKKIILINTVAFSALTVASLASLYAGCLNPVLRSTCSNLTSVITGVATLLMVIFVDPYVSMLTDDVIKGKCTEFQFNRCIIFIVGGLIVGTISAQFLLIPAAEAISFIAKII